MSSRVLALAVLLAAPAARAGCDLQPPAGPFDVDFRTVESAPTAAALPPGQGASITLLKPAPGLRWAPDVGAVETLDGSLNLYGVVRSPSPDPGPLNIAVLVDYAPAVDARVRFFTGSRDSELDGATGARSILPDGDSTIAFDIELPADTISAGSYREIQTVIWFERESVDARRWTAIRGDRPPSPRPCVRADREMPLQEWRSRLTLGGDFTIRAPHSATLAVVPVTASGIGDAEFWVIKGKHRGRQREFAAYVELVAVWEDAFSGPGKNWISSFWSAQRPAMAADFRQD